MMRKRFEKIRCWKPSVGTMIAVLVVAGGVTFALLQAQVKLAGNSIHTETAGLVISQNDSNYGPTASGYDFSGIIPGIQASQAEHFLLKNTGSAALALKLSVPSAPSNPDDVDLSKVSVILTPYNENYMPGTPQSFPLQSLIDADASGGTTVDYPANLQPGSKEEFNVQVSMDTDAASGSSASLSNLDLSFTGVAVSSTN